TNSVACDARVTQRRRKSRGCGRRDRAFERATTGKVGAGGRTGSLARLDVARQYPKDEIEGVVRETATNPVVWVRQAAVQPEPRRLDRSGGEHHDTAVLRLRLAGGADTPGHAAGASALGDD